MPQCKQEDKRLVVPFVLQSLPERIQIARQYIA
jgi:hypothetical protein